METRTTNCLLRLFVTVVMPILIYGGLLTGCVSRAPEWNIQNPYATVDWTRCRQYKANFQINTSMSDGALSPQEVIDRYHALGYSILSLTDHDTWGPDVDPSHPERHKTTWPWQAFDRDPETLGMVAVEGNEITNQHDNHWSTFGSYFNDYGDPESNFDLRSSETIQLEEIGRRGGLAMLFHPVCWPNAPVTWYTRMYQTYPHLIGMEIYCRQGDRYIGDRNLWDVVVTEFAGERSVWGFCNDDMHVKDQIGRHWNLMLLPELSPDCVRRAMGNGTFLFVYAPQGHSGPPPPVVKSITVDPQRGVIHIDATGHESIDWISDGKVVHQGEGVNLGELADRGSYIRAEIRTADGGPIVGTQPFLIQPPAELGRVMKGG